MIIIPSVDIPHNQLQFIISVPLHDTAFDGISPVDKIFGEQLFVKLTHAINSAYYPFRHMGALAKLHSYELHRNGSYLIVDGAAKFPVQLDTNELLSLLSNALEAVSDCQTLLEINRQYTAEEILEYC